MLRCLSHQIVFNTYVCLRHPDNAVAIVWATLSLFFFVYFVCFVVNIIPWYPSCLGG